ncbi:TRAP transporter small permease [Saccharomonospora azurea]|uniref:TRAP transporter small permease n=1 Tax=Saccharomonospora azurea TaxID=40988 RepID=UPI00023FEE39|nr:TRAP transporter small permease [Saccharomonospora azurea]EHK82475.1 TRAP transporter DctQ-like subunit [Saccharomonospora azurea SZMC 14600]
MTAVARIGKLTATVVHALSRTLSVLSIGGMAFVMLIVVYNVVLREVGSPEVRGIVEYSELGMALAAFFALGEAERRRQHVSVNVLLDRFQGTTYRVLRVAGGVGAAFIAVLLAVASWQILSDSLATGEYKLGLVRLPMWPARFAVFAGFLILALEQLVTLVEDIVQRRVATSGPDEPAR